MFGGSDPVSPIATRMGIRVLTLSRLIRIALPPLFISSIPRQAIGFSYPRGREGAAVGGSLFALALLLGYALAAVIGPLSALLSLWLVGGTSMVIIWNTVGGGVAFVKPLCMTCRLRRVIEEHEAVHLSGVASEAGCWEDAKKRYSYTGLGLDVDPRICGFCPIAKRLRER